MFQTLSAEERQDLADALNFRLGFCIHDEDPAVFSEEEWAEVERQYYAHARLYYLLTLTDFLCGHGEVTKNGIKIE